jgi:hypothetical protein
MIRGRKGRCQNRKQRDCERKRERERGGGGRAREREREGGSEEEIASQEFLGVLLGVRL